MYINVTDARGFEIGCNTGVFQPSNHRVLIENNQVYGAENFISYFRDKNGRLNEQEWQMFLQLLISLPTGVYNELSWRHE
jgi:hypothetical protein